MENKNIIDKIDRIHPYPAKFTVDLALEYIEKYTNKNDVVYDPFVGSGTTLFASSLLDRVSFGTDINFIAVLISKFKLLELDQKQINFLTDYIKSFQESYKEECSKTEKFFYNSIDHWFCEDSILILSYIRNNILSIKDEQCSIFCKLVFSSIINSASNQEGDTRYAAIEKPYLNIDYVANLFIKKFNNALSLISSIKRDKNILNKTKPFLHDSKKCFEVIDENSIDLILTSPPYPNTYDYYLYHKHRMNWLGFDVKYSMEKEIGSRREFSSLKHPKEDFNNDMSEIFASCDKLLKKGGHVVLVMGDGKIAGEIYESKSNMIEICSKFGWHLVYYSFTLLDDTSRSFQKSYRTTGKKEHILVFEK